MKQNSEKRSEPSHLKDSLFLSKTLHFDPLTQNIIFTVVPRPNSVSISTLAL